MNKFKNKDNHHFSLPDREFSVLSLNVGPPVLYSITDFVL